jgi:hypothetical protein
MLTEPMQSQYKRRECTKAAPLFPQTPKLPEDNTSTYMSDSATAIRYNTRKTNDSGKRTRNRNQYTTETITRRNQPAKENQKKQNKHKNREEKKNKEGKG